MICSRQHSVSCRTVLGSDEHNCCKPPDTVQSQAKDPWPEIMQTVPSQHLAVSWVNLFNGSSHAYHAFTQPDHCMIRSLHFSLAWDRSVCHCGCVQAPCTALEHHMALVFVKQSCSITQTKCNSQRVIRCTSSCSSVVMIGGQHFCFA